MRKKLSTIIILSLVIFCSSLSITAEASSTQLNLLPVAPRLTSATSIQLTNISLELDLFEDTTNIQGSYSLINPTEDTLVLSLSLPAYSAIYPEGYTPFLNIRLADTDVSYIFDETKDIFQWEVAFEPNEEHILDFEYNFPNSLSDEGILTTGFNLTPEDLWFSNTDKSSLLLHLHDINPGLIREIQPQSYSLIGNTLVWAWDSSPDCKEIIVRADVLTEKRKWEQSFTEKELSHLNQSLSNHYYLSAAFFYENKYKSAPSNEQASLLLGQAYYLEKAGKHEDATRIWNDLYDDNISSPYIYWYLGKEYEQKSSKLYGLYNQISDLQIHPLLQRWLANQLPSFLVKQTLPKIVATSANVDNDLDGLVISGTFTDLDGDIESITLRYRCEENAYIEKTFELDPFQYTHTISYFIPMADSMQKLYYEFIVFDSSQTPISSDKKEVFYLTSEIQSITYPLHGAKLVLGDHSPQEHDKIYKWFKSYLKMASEIKFIPLEGKDPYFIFLGKQHDFIDTYKGPLFLLHTPAPFSPDATKLSVHRYLLSYWYGPGWEQLSPEWLHKLGDGLLLGQGPLVRTLKYLKAKDASQFYELLQAVGQGDNWETALQRIYDMSLFESNLHALWYTFGNNIIAVIIIILFAWLGKSGLLMRLRNLFH